MLLARVGGRMPRDAGCVGKRDAGSYEESKAHAEENGYEYLGPLTLPSFRDDPHHVRCLAADGSAPNG